MSIVSAQERGTMIRDQSNRGSKSPRCDAIGLEWSKSMRCRQDLEGWGHRDRRRRPLRGGGGTGLGRGGREREPGERNPCDNGSSDSRRLTGRRRGRRSGGTGTKAAVCPTYPSWPSNISPGGVAQEKAYVEISSIKRRYAPTSLFHNYFEDVRLMIGETIEPWTRP
jgi:hypothetical protein